MKRSMVLAVLLVGVLAGGCEMLRDLLPKELIDPNANYADLTVYAGGQKFQYKCTVDPKAKQLTGCTEVK